MNDSAHRNDTTLLAIIRAHWGIAADHVRALPTGHTNSSYLITRASTRESWVLRVSWAHKPLRQVQDEAKVLQILDKDSPVIDLATLLPCRVPETVSTSLDQPYAELDDGRWAHLFHVIDGTACRTPFDRGQLRDSMYSLALLHQILRRASIPPERNPVAWMLKRYRRVRMRACPPLPEGVVRADYDKALQRIEDLLHCASAWHAGPVQWLHGDFHAGNVLFDDRRLIGILDFDQVGLGASSIECAFARFALTRHAAIEETFAFDLELWRAGLADYVGAQAALLDSSRADLKTGGGAASSANADATTDQFASPETLTLLFCADQTLIHLEAAQRGLWSLGPGIGFLASWRHILNTTPASPD